MTFESGRMRRSVGVALVLSLVAGAVVAQQKVVNQYIPANKSPWYKESPELPVELAPLWGNRAQGEAGTLLRTPPGFDSGLHSHTADYWAVVVQGTWKHWVPSTGEGVGLTLEPGAHWTQIHTQPHQDACVSKIPCVRGCTKTHRATAHRWHLAPMCDRRVEKCTWIVVSAKNPACCFCSKTCGPT